MEKTMTRELKFRAWDTALKEWNNATYTRQCIQDENENNFGAILFCPQERMIIEQYTGLKDKNGEEIYEGDIIAVESCVDEEEITFYEVYWDEDALEYALRTIRGINYDSCVGELSPSAVIVIGNIHEDQELLGGEE